MTLERTKQLLSSEPDTSNPLALLVEVIASSIELLSLEDNDFAWSSWKNQAEAISELQGILSLAEAGILPERTKVSVLYAPTGPIQEVSVSSGWGEPFLRLAERFDAAERLLWKSNESGSG